MSVNVVLCRFYQWWMWSEEVQRRNPVLALVYTCQKTQRGAPGVMSPPGSQNTSNLPYLLIPAPGRNYWFIPSWKLNEELLHESSDSFCSKPYLIDWFIMKHTLRECSVTILPYVNTIMMEYILKYSIINISSKYLM